MTPPPVPPGCVYTRCYCEENIYLLADALVRHPDVASTQDPRTPSLWDPYVVFISNHQRSVSIFRRMWSSAAGSYLRACTLPASSRVLVEKYTRADNAHWISWLTRPRSGTKRPEKASSYGTTTSCSCCGRAGWENVPRAAAKPRRPALPAAGSTTGTPAARCPAPDAVRLRFLPSPARPSSPADGLLLPPPRSNAIAPNRSRGALRSPLRVPDYMGETFPYTCEDGWEVPARYVRCAPRSRVPRRADGRVSACVRVRSLFRVVPAEEYLDNFVSDRSHMVGSPAISWAGCHGADGLA